MKKKNEDILVNRIIVSLKDRLTKIDEEIRIIEKLLKIYLEKEVK